MRRERRQPTRAEWQAITSPGLVVRRYPAPPASPGPIEDSSTAWDNAKRMFDTATRQAPPLLRGPVHRAMSPTIGSRHLRWAR